MFGHYAIVALTGLVYIAAALVLAQTARVLGPTYHTRVSAKWQLRLFFALLALFFFVRGATFLWPGKLIAVDRMSAFAPIEAAAVLALAAYILDTVMRVRAPPPWSVQFLRLLALVGWDRASLGVAFRTPPAILGDPQPRPESEGRTGRIVIMMGAGAVIAAIACLMAVSSVTSAG